MEFIQALENVDRLCGIAAQEIVSMKNGDIPVPDRFINLKYDISQFYDSQQASDPQTIHDCLFWAIISALRGPDCASDDILADTIFTVKRLTTARIRHAVGLDSLFIDINVHKLIPAETYERDHLLRKMPSHFMSHIMEAVLALRIIGLWEDDPLS